MAKYILSGVAVRVGQGIGRSFTFLILVSHLINLYLPQSRPFTPVHLMQKVKSFLIGACGGVRQGIGRSFTF